MFWEPFDPISYLLHVTLGVTAVFAAIAALAARKGSRLHRRAGWVFTVAMLVAAATTWIFMITHLLPQAMVQATVLIYAVGTAVLALNPRWRGARTGEFALFGLLCLVMLGALWIAARLYLRDSPLFPGPLAMFAILGFFAALDVRYLRLEHVSRIDRVRRHALRMALAVSETVRAPLITFADELAWPVPAIVFGSFLLVPAIYFAFAPRKRRARAAELAAA